MQILQMVLHKFVQLTQEQQVWGIEICHGRLIYCTVMLAKHLAGMGQMCMRNVFCHDEAQGLGIVAARVWE